MIRTIVTIAWLYVVGLMALTQPSWLAALGTLVFYAIVPLVPLLYLLGAPARARRRRALAARGRGDPGGSDEPGDASGSGPRELASSAPAGSGQAGASVASPPTVGASARADPDQ